MTTDRDFDSTAYGRGYKDGKRDAATEITRLKAEVERKDAALEGIRKRRYQNRETVNPDNAFQAFGRLNKEICAIYAECDAALTQEPKDDQ